MTGVSDAPPLEAPPSGEATARNRIGILHLLPLLVFSALAILFLVRLYAGDPSKVPSPLIGRAVPAFTLEPLPGLQADGRPVPGLSDADLRAGRATVVNVWASWCAPCRQEHPLLMALAKDASLRVVGIAHRDNPENARRFLGALGNPFAAVGMDSNARVSIDWGVYGVPETFIVGPDGTIRHKHIGALTPEAMPRFMAALAKARSPAP